MEESDKLIISEAEKLLGLLEGELLYEDKIISIILCNLKNSDKKYWIKHKDNKIKWIKDCHTYNYLIDNGYPYRSI